MNTPRTTATATATARSTAVNPAPTAAHATPGNPGVSSTSTRFYGVLAAFCLPAVLLGGMVDLFDHSAERYSSATIQLPTVTIVAHRSTQLAQADAPQPLQCRA